MESLVKALWTKHNYELMGREFDEMHTATNTLVVIISVLFIMIYIHIYFLTHM